MSRTFQLIRKYNGGGPHTIPQIYADMRWELPLVVNRGESDDECAVLVTEFRQGKAMGYPMYRGMKQRNGWNPDVARGPQVIPESEQDVWMLGTIPFAEAEEILTAWDERVNGPAEPQTVQEDNCLEEALKVVVNMQRREALSSRSTVSDIESAIGNKVFPVGKYRGETVKKVLRNDVGYVRWAIDNLRYFQNINS